MDHKINNLSLFDRQDAKGSAEWSAFDTVQGDHSGMFRVATPIPHQPRYTNTVPIRRYRKPHQLFPKPAH